eukprot:CAMPEP_0117596092 /NCGR_PEP_ID=MMETSP0784-20121206/74116_1 /TAXON_ID=39447 /ORGANISM="" /LENGTH=221 /DNA_ID=CAMNT_0005398327 /DNA_START=551 /DNA_END=1217 /DNA_ORIENTATION=+
MTVASTFHRIQPCHEVDIGQGPTLANSTPHAYRETRCAAQPLYRPKSFAGHLLGATRVDELLDDTRSPGGEVPAMWKILSSKRTTLVAIRHIVADSDLTKKVDLEPARRAAMGPQRSQCADLCSRIVKTSLFGNPFHLLPQDSNAARASTMSSLAFSERRSRSSHMVTTSRSMLATRSNARHRLARLVVPAASWCDAAAKDGAEINTCPLGTICVSRSDDL